MPVELNSTDAGGALCALVGILLLWIPLAVLVGHLAAGKGRSYWGFFLLGLFLSPLAALIIALIAMPDYQMRARQDRREIYVPEALPEEHARPWSFGTVVLTVAILAGFGFTLYALARYAW